MDVIHREEIGPNHSIEIGWSTWNSEEISIRDRWDSANGHFSNTASSEIPITSLPDLLRVALEQLPVVLATRNGAVERP
ncbi:MAG TPA: hypothetical protein VHV32_12210 [Candidatus Angelobacter sp.]|jgi:hypothetical protein|nr:hypothetical protein [Candidatus Angelobacter sp.]